jgi:hypothetical protein
MGKLLSKKMKRLIICSSILFFAFGLTISCNKDGIQLRTGELEIPVCTGFNYKDNSNQSVGKVGQPNNNLISTAKQFSLIVYPIPSAESFSVIVNYNGVKQIWLTRARVSTELNQSLNYLNAPLITVGGAPIFSIANATNQEFRIDVSALSSGYYRLYVMVENELLWENLIINQCH